MLQVFRQRGQVVCASCCRRVVVRRAVLHRSLAAVSAADKNVPISADDVQRLRNQVLDEAAALTRSLYRLCMRSVKLINQGNDADRAEFEAREQKQLNDMMKVSQDERLSGIISMLPPVEPAAELDARSQYYAQYTAENFVSESDCLTVSDDNDNVMRVPDQGQFVRYFYHLRKGEEHRQWLLQDMQFTDPYRLDMDRVQRLESRVSDLMQALDAYQWQQQTPEQRAAAEQAQLDYETYDSDEEAFSDEDDDEDEDDDAATASIRRSINRRRIGDDEEEQD